MIKPKCQSFVVGRLRKSPKFYSLSLFTAFLSWIWLGVIQNNLYHNLKLHRIRITLHYFLNNRMNWIESRPPMCTVAYDIMLTAQRGRTTLSAIEAGWELFSWFSVLTLDRLVYYESKMELANDIASLQAGYMSTVPDCIHVLHWSGSHLITFYTAI